jgi:hypothetical protein
MPFPNAWITFANDETVANDGSKLMPYVSRSRCGGKDKRSSVNITGCPNRRGSICIGLECSNQNNQ